LKAWIKSRTWLRPILKSVNDSRCKTWDLVHGVDTCGEIPLVNLDFHSDHKSAGLEYQSHHPTVIRAALRALPVHHADFTFVDIGCGKGRVLLIASELPFRRIIGLEFAPSLAETARQNIKKYRFGPQTSAPIEVVTGDALDYELPSEPQVLYFYSPFSPPILEQIVAKVEGSFQKSPRDMFIVFSGVIGMRDRAFGSQPQYERILREAHMDLYRHR
jgi:SAM-dependent methyltransferase